MKLLRLSLYLVLGAPLWLKAEAPAPTAAQEEEHAKEESEDDGEADSQSLADVYKELQQKCGAQDAGAAKDFYYQMRKAETVQRRNEKSIARAEAHGAEGQANAKASAEKAAKDVAGLHIKNYLKRGWLSMKYMGNSLAQCALRTPMGEERMSNALKSLEGLTNTAPECAAAKQKALAYQDEFVEDKYNPTAEKCNADYQGATGALDAIQTAQQNNDAKTGEQAGTSGGGGGGAAPQRKTSPDYTKELSTSMDPNLETDACARAHRISRLRMDLLNADPADPELAQKRAELSREEPKLVVFEAACAREKEAALKGASPEASPESDPRPFNSNLAGDPGTTDEEGTREISGSISGSVPPPVLGSTIQPDDI